MGAVDVLERLASAGIGVAVVDNKLRVEPASRLTDDYRAAIRQNREELLALLRHGTTEAVREASEERAGIVEFDADLPQPVAEYQAGVPGPNLATALAAAIHRACDARGDDDANRTALLVECATLGSAGQADMLDHFIREAVRWAHAIGPQQH